MPSQQDDKDGLGLRQASDGTRPPQPERRQLTVMFCDLVGSTALSRRMDPEDLLDILRLFRSTCSEIIGGHGGHVSRYMGDGILALFGYPLAHENDTERATHAALEITEAISALHVPRHDDVELAVRVGMATGLVIAGELIGEGPSREEAIIGETPNLAARMQSLAAPNTVVISDKTRTLLRDAFEYRTLGKHKLKGFTTEVQAWLVIGASDVETRFDAAQTSGLVPLVNRFLEIDLMHRLWADAKTSSSRVLLIEGEAGIGKSRLVKALRDQIAAEAHSALQLQCSPHYQYTALYPFLRYIERTAGFERDDSAKAKRDKLRAVYSEDALPTYERLLSLHEPTGGSEVIEYHPKRQRELTFKTILGRLRRISEELPALVIIEDVHWMDPTSIELLTYLIDNVENANVLFIVTYRPEFLSIWGDRPNVSTVTLDALDSGSGEILAKTVLGDEAASSPIIEQIVKRTEGMPLFIEELAKSLLETGTLPSQTRRKRAVGTDTLGAVPISLMDSLMARIDRLGRGQDDCPDRRRHRPGVHPIAPGTYRPRERTRSLLSAGAPGFVRASASTGADQGDPLRLQARSCARCRL